MEITTIVMLCLVGLFAAGVVYTAIDMPKRIAALLAPKFVQIKGKIIRDRAA